MRKTIGWMAVGLMLCATVCLAQEDARRAMAEELLITMDMPASIEKSFAMMKQMLPAQMEKMHQATGQTNESADMAGHVDKMMDLMADALSWDKIKDDYIALYAETFTVEELKDLIAFYKSPAGQAYTRKQPEWTRRSVEMSQKLMMQIMPKIQAMAKEMATPAPASAPRNQAVP